MNIKLNPVVQNIAFVFVLLSLAGCDNVVTELAVNNKNIQLDETHTLKITKVDEQEKSIGGITKHVYSTTNSFRYSVQLSPQKAVWEAKRAEPKKILICEDAIYLNFFENRVNELYIRENAVVEEGKKKESASDIPKYKMGSFHLKFIDQRYFFKLLGDSFWLDISADEYKSKVEMCSEFEVPNDNEFKLGVATQ